MISIGINGFGRIGKSLFLQLLNNNSIHVAAINAPGFEIKKLNYYLKHDSVHKYSKDFTVELLDDSSFQINGRKTVILDNRSAQQLDWKAYNIYCVADTTGAYLTEEKAKEHNVNYIIMSAPPKDNTPLFVYGGNHEKYANEKVISNASCTTNCIVPVLKHLLDNYGIQHANFTTIHASTSSQSVVDTPHSNSRTNRSIFNNMIPHSTGASISICKIFPELEGKIRGTSVRVPTNNVSLVDLNVCLEKETTLDELFDRFKDDPYIEIVNENIVSSDFISTTCPCIIDQKASLDLNNNQFKLMIWYDNEWSYANQLIQLINVISNHHRNPYFIEKQNFHNKEVVLRLDLNVPLLDGKITNDLRITSTLPTIKRILQDSPKRLVLLSHMGRPKGVDPTMSLSIIVKCLEGYLQETVEFLPFGLSDDTLSQIYCSENRIFLMENLRFHSEETNYKQMEQTTAMNVIQMLGNCYVNDAFGCLHRDHLSINGINMKDKAFGYLVDKELKALHKITQSNSSEKVLAIIGGGKMDDKLELLKKLSKKVDHIYIAGGNINSLLKNNMSDYLGIIESNKAKITLMEDGLCGTTFEDIPTYSNTKDLPKKSSFFDIGLKSLNTLYKLLETHDTIFWNGTLGVVENENYKNGSQLLVSMLIQTLKIHPHKTVIVGGGDTGGFVSNYNHNFTHVSTGGGAAIEYITDEILIGLFQFMN